MKRNVLFILSLVAVILVSCNHDDFSAKRERVTIKAFQDVTTRVAFDGEKSTWCDGDCLNVVIEGLEDIYTFNYDTTTECDFGCDNLTMPAEQNDVYAFYGVGAENINVVNKTASVALGAEHQSQSADTPTAHIAQYDVLYGKALGSGRSDISIAMKHSVVAIKIELTNSLQEDVEIKSVTFTAPEGVVLTGNYTIDSVADEISLADDVASSNSVIVEFDEAISLEAAGNCTAWIAVAPFALAEGDNLTIDITSSDDTVYRCEKVMPAGGISFNAGSVMSTEIALGNNAQLVGPDAPAEITIVVDPSNDLMFADFPTTSTSYDAAKPFYIGEYPFVFDSSVPFYCTKSGRIRFTGITSSKTASILLPRIEGYILDKVTLASIDENKNRGCRFAVLENLSDEITTDNSEILTSQLETFDVNLSSANSDCYIYVYHKTSSASKDADLAYISLTYSKLE